MKSGRIWFEIYWAFGSGWRWRAKAPNGKVVARSKKPPFLRVYNCRRSIQCFYNLMLHAGVGGGAKIDGPEIRMALE